MMIEKIEDALSFIHGLYATGEKSGLANMRALLSRLGDPQARLRMVHVAGTNGKGSTCATLEAILRAAGYRTGLYTSPYLQAYNERIRLSGMPIGAAALTDLVRRTAPVVEQLACEGVHVTEFEYGTALALCAFAQARVDIAVIEVGLGGRLDPTNVITPLLCAITAIGMDHMQYLGDTLEAIAGEKAGILKPGVPVVVSHMEESARRVIAATAERGGAPALFLDGKEVVCLLESAHGQRIRFALGDFCLNGAEFALPGAHQLDNAACALSCVLKLRTLGFDLSEAALREGLACVRWPGRLEWIGNVLLDGAHNPQGVGVLCAYLRRHLDPAHTVLLTGMLADKDVSGMCALLRDRARAVVTAPPPVPRAMPPQELADCFAKAGARKVTACTDAETALKSARSLAGPDDVIVCAGSLYLIGTLRTLLCGEEKHGL